MLIAQNESARAQSSSKIILSGEHSVLFGKPAIAVPFSILTSDVFIEPSESDDILINSSFFKGRLNHCHSQFEGIRFLVYSILDYLNKPHKNILIHIESSIPIGKGLGSSSSIALSTTKALFAYFGYTIDQTTLLWFVNKADEKIHDRSSSLDTTTIQSKDLILFQNKQVLDQLNSPGRYQFLLVDTGKQALTKESVETVQNKMKDNPARTNKYIRIIGSITEAIKNVLNSSQSKQETLGQLLNANQTILHKLDVSDPKIDSLINVSKKLGAYGAKLTGAGQGGCLIVLVKNEKQVEQISSTLLQEGAQSVTRFTI